MTRIDDTFARLKAEGKKAFVAYIMGGDPDEATSLAVMQGLPAAGVDVIELGMPFTDPMADGPTIQAAGQRALEGGMTMDKVLNLVRALLLQPDLFPRRRPLPDRRDRGRDRRPDRRRPAARGG